MDQQPITQAAMQKALSNKRAAMQKTLDNRFEQLMSRINTRLAMMLRGKTEPPRPSGPSDDNTPASKDRWNAAKLGYFDPHLDKSYPKGDIITVNKKT